MSSPLGSSSSSNSSSQASNQTTVNVQSTTDLSVDTSDLATALQTLAGAQQEQAALSFLGTQATAAAQVKAAQIAAGAGPSWSTILIVAAALLGLLFTAGAVKLPRGLRA